MLHMRHIRGHGVRIDGTAGELEALRREIVRLAGDGTGSIVVPGQAGFDPAPYESVIAKAVLTVGPGAARVEVHDGVRMTLTASPDNLLRFASHLDVPEDAQHGWHAHYQYFEGTEYIAPESEPVLIALRHQGLSAPA
jgi:hypothetical protein